MKYQAIGEAIKIEISINFIKSRLSMTAIWATLAPNTFRIPISFFLFRAVNVELEAHVARSSIFHVLLY